jgi:DNA-binding Lrp family transcriptional regulator
MCAQVMKGKRRAFIFIDVAPGKEKAFVEKLMRYNEVIEAHLIAGQYDVFAVLEFEMYGRGVFWSAQEFISKFVLEKIRKLKDVRDTNTLLPTFSVIKRDQEQS